LKTEAVLLTLILFSLSFITVYGESRITRIIVYGDGVVGVEENIYLLGEEFEVTVPILSEKIENLIVEGEGGVIPEYDLGDKSLKVETLGITQLKIYYETQELTWKKGAAWTLRVNLTNEAEIIFPKNSTIIYLSSIPEEISVEDGSPKLSLTSGEWEITYIVEVSPHRIEERIQVTQFMIPATGVGVGVSAVIAAYFFLKKRKKPLELSMDEKKVLELIREKGKVSEAEIRMTLRLPKTTTWRIVRRLERKGLVRVRKIGGRNEVEPA